MFRLLMCARPENECAKILRIARWGEDCHVKFPRCHSPKIEMDGHYRKVYQKYFCHSCERWFNDKTGILFHYSRTPLNVWFLALYLFFVLWIGCSILAISNEFLIPYERCYHMIRTLMERISANIVSGHRILKQKVESDEFYMKAGLKGRSYHEEIISLGREPRKRALKPWWRGRGIFQKDQPMIVCLHQRIGSATEFYAPQRKRQPLLGTLKEHIEPHGR
jgi:transposase-like protein